MNLEFPDLSIVGAPKCGTSSLHYWLGQLEDVCPAQPKETFYFMDTDNPFLNSRYNFHKSGSDDFKRFFKGCKSGKTLDSTTHYFYQQTAMEQLGKAGTKICVVLREPTARLVSYFQYVCLTRDALVKPVPFGEFARGLLDADLEKFRDHFREDKEFFSLATSLSQGYYTDYLEKWKEHVSDSNLLILLFEDLIADQKTCLQQIVNFFGISVAPDQLMQLDKDNETYRAKHAGINRLVRIASRLIENERIKRPLRKMYVKFQKGEMANLYSQFPEEIAMIREHYVEHSRRFQKFTGFNLDRWDLA